MIKMNIQENKSIVKHRNKQNFAKEIVNCTVVKGEVINDKTFWILQIISELNYDLSKYAW